MKLSYTYILRCRDNSFYTGVTSDIIKRWTRHVDGYYENCYTRGLRPLVLEHIETFGSMLDAIQREKQIKKWSRSKKQSLIDGDIGLCPKSIKSFTSKEQIDWVMRTVDGSLNQK